MREGCIITYLINNKLISFQMAAADILLPLAARTFGVRRVLMCEWREPCVSPRHNIDMI